MSMSMTKPNNLSGEGTPDDEGYLTGENVQEVLDIQRTSREDQEQTRQQNPNVLPMSSTSQHNHPQNQENIPEQDSTEPLTTSSGNGNGKGMGKGKRKGKGGTGMWLSNKWEYVSVHSDEEKEFHPKMESTDLLYTGTRTRNMRKAGTGPGILPTQTRNSPTPKSKRKRKPSNALETVDDDNNVVPKRRRILKQPDLHHEKTIPRPEVQQETQPAIQPDKQPDVQPGTQLTASKSSKRESTKPQIQGRKTKPRNFQKKKKPGQQVRIAEGAVEEDPQPDDRAQDEPQEGEADERIGVPIIDEEAHKRTIREEFYVPFRAAFSMSYFWPNYDPVAVHQILQAKANSGVSLTDISPKHIAQSWDKNMAKHDRGPQRDQAEASETCDKRVQQEWSANNATPVIDGSIDEQQQNSPQMQVQSRANHASESYERLEIELSDDVTTPSGVYRHNEYISSDKEASDGDSVQKVTAPIPATAIEGRRNKARTPVDVIQPSVQWSTDNDDNGNVSNDGIALPEDLEIADSDAGWGSESSGNEWGDSCWERKGDYDEEDEENGKSGDNDWVAQRQCGNQVKRDT